MTLHYSGCQNVNLIFWILLLSFFLIVKRQRKLFFCCESRARGGGKKLIFSPQKLTTTRENKQRDKDQKVHQRDLVLLRLSGLLRQASPPPSYARLITLHLFFFHFCKTVQDFLFLPHNEQKQGEKKTTKKKVRELSQQQKKKNPDKQKPLKV